jgi:FixJ family two-component response regulator
VDWHAQFFATREEFFTQPSLLVPGCLLLDLDLPEMAGLELQNAVADRCELPIIFTARQANIPMTVRAMKAGAVDALVKPFSDETLSRVILEALERSRSCICRETGLRNIRERCAPSVPASARSWPLLCRVC